MFSPPPANGHGGKTASALQTEQKPWITWLLGSFLIFQLSIIASWRFGVLQTPYTAHGSMCISQQAAAVSNNSAILADKAPTETRQRQCNCTGAATLPEGLPPPSQALPLPDFKLDTLWGGFSQLDGVQLERFWTADTLKNALVVAPTAQMEPVFKKLYSGQALTVVALGSSIVEGAGCYHRSLEDFLKLVPRPMSPIYGSRHQPKGWLELFMRYINNKWPHPDHILVNSGASGYSPAMFNVGMCFESSLPQQTDILIIETMAVPDVLSIEKLLWRALKHFESHGSPVPAVIIYNSLRVSDGPPRGLSMINNKTRLSWCAIPPNWPAFPQPATDYTGCCACYVRSMETTAWDRKKNGGEGVHNSLAEYYGIASISHRSFLWPYYQAKAWEKMKLPYGECEFFAMTHRDYFHNSKLGHLLIADYFWTYMSTAHEAYIQRTELAQSNKPEDHFLLENKRSFPALPFDPLGREIYLMHCYGYLGYLGQKWKDTPLTEFFPIVGGNGFDFTMNTTHGNTQLTRPGWVALTPGAFMDVKLSTVFGGKADGQLAEVAVMHLQSYEHMGKANVTCVSGCTCDAITVNAHIKNRVSITGAATVIASEHAECVIRIQVLPESDSGEYKFKVPQIITRKLVKD